MTYSHRIDVDTIAGPAADLIPPGPAPDDGNHYSALADWPFDSSPTEIEQAKAEPDRAEATANGCPFCAIVTGTAEATMVATWPDAIAFVPLNPVTPGHTLVIPTVHVADATTAATARRAAAVADTLPPNEWNLITSVGTNATQTVYHLHIYLIPRRDGDCLQLPWPAQKRNP